MNSPRKEKRSASPAESGSRRKRCRGFPMTINSLYLSKEFKSIMKEAYLTKKSLKYQNAEYQSQPFSVCSLPNFITEEELLKRLKEELLELPFNEKNNDLYTFHQSDDLSNFNTRYIKWIKKLLYDDFRNALTEITGIDLNDKMDISCSQYGHGDILLCHDDELEERRIAFILYLVPAWKEEDGGMLDLYECDAKGHPNNVVKSFLPIWNNFIFFEVNAKSFHRVSEVLSVDKTRLTISGWFHGPPLERFISPLKISHDIKMPQFISESVLRSWINPTYLESEIQMQIQEKFQTESEIKLNDFLNEDKFLEVEKTLLTNDLHWIDIGPANKCNYQQADNNSLPLIIKECISVFQSEAMFLILSNLTGLTFHHLIKNVEKDTKETASTSSDTTGTSESLNKKEKEITAKCHYEIRQWKHESYTLIQDEDKKNGEYALDAIFFFNCKDWNENFGGFTSYIAKDEDEELLSVCPVSNSLALVYRDKETLSFVKYINSRMKDQPSNCYQDLFFVYYE